MNNRGLIGSVGLNGVLAVSLILILTKKPVPTDQQPSPPLVSPSTPTLPTRPASPAPPATTLRVVPVPFHWSQVESEDYQEYIANLREIGCPEETIRDIIIADVNSLFEPRYAALSRSVPELAWWGRFDARKPLRADLAMQLHALNEEKKALLTRLLGPSAGADLAFTETHVTDVREAGLFSFLPESKRGTVRDLVKRFQAMRERNEFKWKGLPTDERNALEKELRDSLNRELTNLLTPEEMREFEVRDSLTSDLVREVYGKADLTESEFRSMYELRRDLEERHPEPSSEDWKALEDTYADRLGPERFEEVRRQNDSMWNAMQNLADEPAFTPDAMSQAYALKQEYSEKLARAIGDMFADPQQNPQPLREITAEMDSRLAAIIGIEGVQQLDRIGVLPRLVVMDDGIRKSYSLSRSAFGK